MDNQKKDTSNRKNSLLEELRSLSALVFNADKAVKEIAFYSSQAQYISYYQGLLNELINRRKEIFYLTSDLQDPMLSNDEGKILSYYSKSFLPLNFQMINSPVVITTIPDIQQYKLQRTFSGTNYVYIFHSLVSTHMMYRKGAFDYYDTIFCVGPHHLEEIRKTEKLYNLPKKDLHEVGYYRLEKIHAQHQEYLSQHSQNTRKLVLIAAGWQEDNLLNTCADELIDSLLKEDCEVVFRPHPMTIAHIPEKLYALKEKYSAYSRFHMDTQTTSEKYLHNADVMICDWSGVALEYAFGTERPVLFVDLPRKIYNPEYEKLGLEPLEVRLREQIGQVVKPEQAEQAGRIVQDFLARSQEYRERIVEAREKNVYNFGESSKIGADIIQTILDEDIRGATQPW
jgi:YidC/Oxa1 family membrane protein insertase